jgi:hypothetical protein
MAAHLHSQDSGPLSLRHAVVRVQLERRVWNDGRISVHRAPAVLTSIKDPLGSGTSAIPHQSYGRRRAHYTVVMILSIYRHPPGPFPVISCSWRPSTVAFVRITMKRPGHRPWNSAGDPHIIARQVAWRIGFSTSPPVGDRRNREC